MGLNNERYMIVWMTFECSMIEGNGVLNDGRNRFDDRRLILKQVDSIAVLYQGLIVLIN